MKYETCWDFWDCPLETREKCPAYKTNSGKDCYDLAREFCPRLQKGFKHCWECPWYQKIKDDEEEE